MLSAKVRSNLLFDVSSGAGTQLGHLLQQQLAAFQIRVDNIPGVSSGVGQIHTVYSHVSLP